MLSIYNNQQVIGVGLKSNEIFTSGVLLLRTHHYFYSKDSFSRNLSETYTSHLRPNPFRRCNIHNLRRIHNISRYHRYSYVVSFFHIKIFLTSAITEVVPSITIGLFFFLARVKASETESVQRVSIPSFRKFSC